MDENIVFDNTQAPQSPPSSEAPAPPPDQPPSDQPPPDQPPPDQPTEGASIKALEDSQPPAAVPKGGMTLKQKLIIGSIIFFILFLLIILIIPKNKSEKTVTLVWWGLWEDSSTMQGIISDFHREHPTITVKYVKQNKDQYRDRLIARVKNQTGTEIPDIFRYHNSWYPMISDILVPLPSDVITTEEFQKIYYKVIQDDVIHDGAIYGIPLGADSLALYVNKDLLDKAGVPVPKNWDDFRKAAIKLTVRDQETGKIKRAGAAIGLYDNVTHAPDIISLLFTQQKVDISKPAATLANEKSSFEYYTDFAKKDKINEWDKYLNESVRAFANEEVAMYIGYSWDAFRIMEWNNKLKFEVYDVPELYGKKTTIASYWIEGVSIKSPYKNEALLFMKHLAKKETIQKLYSDTSKKRKFGEPYARRDLGETLKNDKLVYPFVRQLDDAKSTIFSSDTADGDTGLNTQSNAALKAVINDIIDNSSSSDSSIDEFNAAMGNILGKYTL